MGVALLELCHVCVCVKKKIVPFFGIMTTNIHQSIGKGVCLGPYGPTNGPYHDFHDQVFGPQSVKSRETRNGTTLLCRI